MALTLVPRLVWLAEFSGSMSGSAATLVHWLWGVALPDSGFWALSHRGAGRGVSVAGLGLLLGYLPIRDICYTYHTIPTQGCLHNQLLRQDITRHM